jgi:hypothetical protein
VHVSRACLTKDLGAGSLTVPGEGDRFAVTWVGSPEKSSIGLNGPRSVLVIGTDELQRVNGMKFTVGEGLVLWSAGDFAGCDGALDTVGGIGRGNTILGEVKSFLSMKGNANLERGGLLAVVHWGGESADLLASRFPRYCNGVTYPTAKAAMLRDLKETILNVWYDS